MGSVLCERRDIREGYEVFADGGSEQDGSGVYHLRDLVFPLVQDIAQGLEGFLNGVAVHQIVLFQVAQQFD